METRGTFAPETRADALEYYEEVGPVAQVVVREATKAMSFGADVRRAGHAEVIRTARDATFARCSWSTSTSEGGEFDEWAAPKANSTRTMSSGSGPTTSTTSCGPIPFADTVIAATYQEEPDAACQHPPPERVRPSVARSESGR